MVVLNSSGVPIARTSYWIEAAMEGQDLIAIPRLHVEHEAALAIMCGTGLGVIFKDARIKTADWEEDAGFIGGSWQLWRTSRPELTITGFVRGSYTFNIERAVRGLTKLLT